MLILVKEEFLSDCRNVDSVQSESLKLVWKQVPDSGSSDYECPTAECATSTARDGQQATTRRERNCSQNIS